MKYRKSSQGGLPGFMEDARQAMDEEYQKAKADYEHWEKLICSVFIQAVLAHDKTKIIKLAKAAAFWKGKLGRDFKPQDRVRYMLLKLKISEGELEQPMLIREIAKFAYNEIEFRSYAVNSFSRLKEICREIGLPFRLSGHQTKLKNKR